MRGSMNDTTNWLTRLANAAPMTMPTARSTTLPRMTNSRKPFSISALPSSAGQKSLRAHYNVEPDRGASAQHRLGLWLLHREIQRWGWVGTDRLQHERTVGDELPGAGPGHEVH